MKEMGVSGGLLPSWVDWNEWNSISFPTSKEMKEIYFIGKLGYSTMALWDDSGPFETAW